MCHSQDFVRERTLLSAGLLDLGCNTDANQSVVWLELLESLWGIVDEGETGGLATTELGLETENVDLLLAGLVQLSELGAELVLGDVGAGWVEDIPTRMLGPLLYPVLPTLPSLASAPEHLHDHLLPAQERVADELARPQSNWLLTVGHVCGMCR